MSLEEFLKELAIRYTQHIFTAEVGWIVAMYFRYTGQLENLPYNLQTPMIVVTDLYACGPEGVISDHLWDLVHEMLKVQKPADNK